MLGADAFKKMKNTAYVVNVARGGLVDEEALYAALEDRQIAGAAVDVFVKEPSTDLPFFKLDNVVVTPHLGASTDEAQEKAGVSVAKSVRLALAGELVPDAVNVAGGVIAPDVRPGIPLIEKLGRIFTALTHASRDPDRRRGRRRNRRARRQGPGTRRPQGHLRGRRHRAGLLCQRPRDRRAARHQRPPDHHPRGRGLPQRADLARRPRATVRRSPWPAP